MPPLVLVVYANPAAGAHPVPPVGAERVAWGFHLAGCRVRVTAPFLEEDPLADLGAELAAGPDLVAFSLRNLDDSLVAVSDRPGHDGDTPDTRDVDTLDFLPAVRPLVRAALDAVGPDRVLLGGMGVSVAPDAVLQALDARWAVVGPAEDLVLRLGRALAIGQRLPDVLGSEPRAARAAPLPRDYRFLPGAPPRMRAFQALARARQGRLPLVVATGCNRRCFFCVEATCSGRRVALRPPGEVAAEAACLLRRGHRRFWLAADELNVPDHRHAVAVLRSLAGLGADLDLLAFLAPAPAPDDLLDAMEAAGLPPEAVHWELGHLDDTLLRAGAGPANQRHLEALVERYLRRGYRTLGGSVLLGGHPLETEASLSRALDVVRTLDRALPDGLGLSYTVGARVYPSSPLGRWVEQHPDEARPHLHGAATQPGPVVFCRPAPPRTLLRDIRHALAGVRGPMAPMGAGSPLGPDPTEHLVNRSILAEDAGDFEVAAGHLEAALGRDPHHPEALARLGLLRANRLGDRAGAAEVLGTLLSTLGPTDPRREEVLSALRACASA